MYLILCSHALPFFFFIFVCSRPIDPQERLSVRLTVFLLLRRECVFMICGYLQNCMCINSNRIDQSFEAAGAAGRHRFISQPELELQRCITAFKVHIKQHQLHITHSSTLCWINYCPSRKINQPNQNKPPQWLSEL
jgi:hypothetical protein